MDINEDETINKDEDKVDEQPIVSHKRKKHDLKESEDQVDDDDSEDSEDEDEESEVEEAPIKHKKKVKFADVLAEDNESGDDEIEETPIKHKNNKKKVKFADVLAENDEESENESGDELNEEDDDDDDDDVNSEDFDDSEDEEVPKEDIYGRVIDKKGNLVKESLEKKNEKLQKRLKELEDKHVETDKDVLTKLSKQINGLLNRLSTLNIHNISTQIIQLFYSNQYTRYDLINTLETLLKQILLSKNSLIPDRLHAEYAALISILSSNIGIELGATILTNLILLFNEKFQNTENIEEMFKIDNKYLDNLLTFICYLYNFKLFSSVLIFDIINEFIIKHFANKGYLFEKLIDFLVIILRKIGFILRKDNPIQLKDFIISLKSKLNELHVQFEGNSRLKFMLESLVAIKNNDIRKLTESYYSDDQINTSEDIHESLIKRIKSLYSTNLKYNDVQLNINLNDLLNSNKHGKWWIVGSAWTSEEVGEKGDGEEIVDSKTKKLFKQHNNNFSQKLLELARKQHMNTDIRRTIFCIIMSAEVSKNIE